VAREGNFGLTTVDGESRALGEHERLLHYLHAYGGLIALQVLHVRGPLEVERVEEALAWLQAQHPMLRGHIRYGEIVFRDKPPFVYRQPYLDTTGTTPIPVRSVTDDWEEVMAKELRTPIRKGRNPRLRVVLVRDPADEDLTHLVVTADHTTLDAYSCNMMSRQLLEYLADPRAKRAEMPRQTHLPPPLEAGLPKKPQSNRPYEPAIRLPMRKVPRTKPATRVVGRTIPEKVVSATKADARSKGATLHGALAAAFLLAMRDRYGVEAMTCLSSVDLRRMMKPPLPADTYGCYIDILRTRHEIGDFWKTARDVSFRLVSTFAKDHENASIVKMPGWEIYKHESWKTMTHARRIDGLAITTAGESNLRVHYGNRALEDVTMAVSLDTFGPGIVVITSEREGALDVSVNYATRAIAKSDVAALADRALAILSEAVTRREAVAS
jgi:hypothetical protein